MASGINISNLIREQGLENGVDSVYFLNANDLVFPLDLI